MAWCCMTRCVPSRCCSPCWCMTGSRIPYFWARGGTRSFATLCTAWGFIPAQRWCMSRSLHKTKAKVFLSHSVYSQRLTFFFSVCTCMHIFVGRVRNLRNSRGLALIRSSIDKLMNTWIITSAWSQLDNFFGVAPGVWSAVWSQRRLRFEGGWDAAPLTTLSSPALAFSASCCLISLYSRTQKDKQVS